MVMSIRIYNGYEHSEHICSNTLACVAPLKGSQLPKMKKKSRFVTCFFYWINRVEAVGLSVSNKLFQITILRVCENYQISWKKKIFYQQLFNQSLNLNILLNKCDTNIYDYMSHTTFRLY